MVQKIRSVEKFCGNQLVKFRSKVLNLVVFLHMEERSGIKDVCNCEFHVISCWRKKLLRRWKLRKEKWWESVKVSAERFLVFGLSVFA